MERGLLLDLYHIVEELCTASSCVEERSVVFLKEHKMGIL